MAHYRQSATTPVNVEWLDAATHEYTRLLSIASSSQNPTKHIPRSRGTRYHFIPPNNTNNLYTALGKIVEKFGYFGLHLDACDGDRRVWISCIQGNYNSFVVDEVAVIWTQVLEGMNRICAYIEEGGGVDKGAIEIDIYGKESGEEDVSEEGSTDLMVEGLEDEYEKLKTIDDGGIDGEEWVQVECMP